MKRNKEKKKKGWYSFILAKRAEDDDKSSFPFFFFALSLSPLWLMCMISVTFRCGFSRFFFSLKERERERQLCFLMSYSGQ